jgi:hypothetical protein
MNHIAQLGRLAAQQQMQKQAVRGVAGLASALKKRKFKAPTAPKPSSSLGDLRNRMLGLGGDLESLGSGAIQAQKKQYADLLTAAQKAQPGFQGPLLLPGMRGFKYPTDKGSLAAAGNTDLGRVLQKQFPARGGRSTGQAVKLKEIATDVGNK